MITKSCVSDGLAYTTNPIQYRCKNCGGYWFSGTATPKCKVDKEQLWDKGICDGVEIY